MKVLHFCMFSSYHISSRLNNHCPPKVIVSDDIHSFLVLARHHSYK